ncbi:MAG: oleandomycin transport system ATP-binding protein, partial [Baekduia sp.]|nr:oleandomycin transport system ATP-binding protein [Baekduia sp.]
MNSNPPVIDVEGVEKSFGSTTALAGVDLAVETGTVLALLGRNGAGQTTRGRSI